MSGTARADKAYVIDGQECWTLRELVEAMAQRWDQASEHLTGGYIGKWIENALGDIDAKIALDRLLKEELPADEVLYAFLASHWGEGAPPFRGVPITFEQLDKIARDDLPEGLNKRQFVCDLHRLEILPRAAQASGDARLAEIDTRWQEEFLNYCTTHVEMLAYEEVWNDHGGAMEMFLYDPQTEAFVLQHFMNDRRDEAAARVLAVGTKVNLFDALFDADYADRFRFDRNGDSVPLLRTRAWFAAMMDREGESSLGRDMALTTASFLAAGEQGALTRQLEANQEQMDAAGEDWPFRKLDQKAHAIGYGAAMSVAAVMGIWDPFGWSFDENYQTGTTVALAVAAFYFATLYGAVAQQRSNGVMILIAVATFTLGMIPIAFLASGAWYLDVLTFGGAFAVLGLLRKPIIAAKRKDVLKLEQKGLEGRLAGSANREEDPDVILGYLNFWANGVPRHKILEHSRRQGMGGISPSSSPAQAIQQTAKAKTAAYQANGTSYEVMGMNVGADGAVTHELVDGISFDNKGRVNTRVVDGVTLHSDGKVTTNVTKGVDIRSDGQVSVEMLGFRHNWGGKKDDKKKDSWF